jgi:hypothetical protein
VYEDYSHSVGETARDPTPEFFELWKDRRPHPHNEVFILIANPRAPKVWRPRIIAAAMHQSRFVSETIS